MEKFKIEKIAWVSSKNNKFWEKFFKKVIYRIFKTIFFFFYEIFSNKWCMLSCTLYGLYSIVVIGFDELYPLLLATAIKYGNGVTFDFTS